MNEREVKAAAFERGAWAAFNEVLAWINTQTEQRVDKKHLYRAVMEMRPTNCAIAALDAARGDGWQMTEPPTDTLILAVVPYNVQHGNGPKIAMTERYVCKIDDAGDLLTEGGDDIGWRGEDITAWRECPALPGDGE